MSSPTLHPPSGSLPPDLQIGPILATEGQGSDELAVRVEQQRASIRVLEPVATSSRIGLGRLFAEPRSAY